MESGALQFAEDLAGAGVAGEEDQHAVKRFWEFGAALGVFGFGNRVGGAERAHNNQQRGEDGTVHSMSI